MTVRTRFAPSPTGLLHIGNLRSAIYAYALARHYDGQFILRIEDTDQKREVAGATQALQDTLHKFGIDWDEFYIQSQRKADGLYLKAAQKLVAQSNAFYCQCPPKNAKTEGYTEIVRDPCRDKGFTSGAIKLRVPDNEKVSYRDFAHKKEISWDTNTVYDATLLKTDGFPTYHLAVAVDDIDMKVTHILRGHDWLPSTPVHLLVFKYLGGPLPEIGHLTDILSAESGKKLSKRRDSVFVDQFLDSGYLPEALLNFIMLLGWAPKDNSELFTLADFVKHFDPSGFQEANPKFLYNKLDWFNGYYIRKQTDTQLTQLVKSYVKDERLLPNLTQIVPLIKDRLVKLNDINDLASFAITPPNYTNDIWPDVTSSLSYLNFALDFYSQLTAWDKESIENGITDQVKSNGWKVGDFFMSLRIALCGSRATPPTTDVLLFLGKVESLSRIQTAIKSLSDHV